MISLAKSPDLFIGMRLIIRARFISISVWLLASLTLVVLLAAQFSGRQPATVALDVGISTIRLALPIVIVLLAQELFSREFDRRYFLTTFAYPRSRNLMYLGRFAAMFTMTLTLLATMTSLLAIMIWLVGRGYAQATPVALDHHYVLTIGFIAIDLFVISSLASFLAIIASTPSFVLIGTLGFMVVARSFSNIIMLLTEQYWLVSSPEIYRESLGFLGYLLPDLGALDIRAITLYGTMDFLPSEWPALLLTMLSYSGIFIGASLLALQRKRFS